MRNPQGYAIVVDPEGPPKEADTVTCSHCQRLVFVGGYVDPTELGGFCRMCMKHICGPCADKGACVPFEKKLEEFERKARFHQAVGTILGSIVLFFFLSASAFSADLYISWTDASSDEDSFEIYRATSDQRDLFADCYDRGECNKLSRWPAADRIAALLL